MKKLLSLLLALILIANSSLSIFACEVDPECECPCHQPDPYFGAEYGDHGDDKDPNEGIKD